MQNRTRVGPTRQDKTAERMQQERESPGATTAGGEGADDVEAEHLGVPDSGPPKASSNPAARRGNTTSEAATPPSTDAAARPPASTR